MAIALGPIVQAAVAATLGWFGGKAAGAAIQGVQQHMSTSRPAIPPAEQSKNAEENSQALSPGDPKEPCGQCGKEERQKKRRKELEEEAGVEQKTKGPTRLGEKDGGMGQANTDFDSLEPSNVKEIETVYGPGRVGGLDDGSTVVVRPGSTDGRPTLEFRNPGSRRGAEIRYNFSGS